MKRHTFTDVILVALVGFSTVLAAAPKVDADKLLTTVRILASPEFDGRRTGTPGGLKARAWVAERFKAIGLEPLGGSHLASFSFTRRSVASPIEGANIVGMCRGTARADETMVVTAHYDHVGVRDSAIYHGADDNASGVAVLLAIAEHCRREPFKHDTLFVAFDAEEMGLQGARAFVANPPIAKARLALNINLDMVSRGDKGELYAAGTYHWPKTKPALAAAAKRAPIKLLFGHDEPISPTSPKSPLHDWTNQSDHGRFHAAGIPFVYFGVEDHPDYHQPTDTPEKINPMFFKQAAETILDAIIALDAALPFR